MRRWISLALAPLLALPVAVVAASPISCSSDSKSSTPEDTGPKDTGPPVCAASAAAPKPACVYSPNEADPCKKEVALRFYYTCNLEKCPEIGCKQINPSDAGSYSFWCCQREIP